ncbi:transposase [Advenella sp. RU8]|uniref:transposase n=1 Tax=Advenella sp. RU8 TaxID=3399575 RepID=UPI003AAFCE25
MGFTWALGTSADDPHTIEIIDEQKQLSYVGLDALVKEGVPAAKKMTRLVFEGELSSLMLCAAHYYQDGMGIKLPEGANNRHEVFTFNTENGLTGYVPVLVLMRAFFKPHKFVLPAVFTPVGVDLLSFVNYAESPPTVVVDDNNLRQHGKHWHCGPNKTKLLYWLQISKSANGMAQSVYKNALRNKLGLLLPKGQVRIIFHGQKAGDKFYVSKATLISVSISAEDSIACKNEEIIFHAMADPAQKATASIRNITIPLHLDGQSAVSDDEWAVVEPLLKREKNGRLRLPQRELLNVVLNKLASDVSWKKVARGDFSITDLTAAFRRWTTTGRFELVLDCLRGMRSNNRVSAR